MLDALPSLLVDPVDQTEQTMNFGRVWVGSNDRLERTKRGFQLSGSQGCGRANDLTSHSRCAYDQWIPRNGLSKLLESCLVVARIDRSETGDIGRLRKDRRR